MASGRPSPYNAELARRICDAISVDTKGLKYICEDNPDFPCPSTIRLWVAQKPEFSDLYAHAKRAQMDAMADELDAIASESPTCEVPDPDGGSSTRIDAAGVQRNRLRVDTRKWLMSKLAPKIYGEKIQQQITDAEGGPVQFVVKSILDK